jgi:uncharacterized metal-binding protein
MKDANDRFSLDVDAVAGYCPSGEAWAEDKIARGAVPVLSCEGPCIRGEIARLSANLVARQPPYARACYAETILVPHSAMARWVKQAEEVVVIDGCFLKCIGRVVNNLVDRERVVHIDALPLHKRFSKVFHMDDVAEDERRDTAQSVAEKILGLLKDRGTSSKPDVTHRDCASVCAAVAKTR